jgi:hypothetical protein
MLVPEDVSFVYGYGGGMPPKTLEIFSIRVDRQIRYFTANPWPRQPPYDEIGFYNGQIPNEVFDEVQMLADRSLASTFTNRGTIYADSGVEYIDATINNQKYSVSWNPSFIPKSLEPLVSTIRNLIKNLRDCPSSVLQIDVKLTMPQRDNIGITFRNRGSAPFRMYGRELEIRLHLTDKKLFSKGDDPITLLRYEPVKLPENIMMDICKDDMVEVRPRGDIVFQVPNPFWAEYRKSLGKSFDLYCLARVCFSNLSIRNEHYIQEGWLLTHCMFN